MKKSLKQNHDQNRLEKMLARIKALNFRLTPQRIAVLEVLAASVDHPSVAQVHAEVAKRFPTTSLATVYKTVFMLKELGEVLELGFPDGSNRYDGAKPFSHPHVVCSQCRRIMDPELETLDDLSEEMQKKTGYKIISHRMDFFGLCPECQDK